MLGDDDAEDSNIVVSLCEDDQEDSHSKVNLASADGNRVPAEEEGDKKQSAFEIESIDEESDKEKEEENVVMKSEEEAEEENEEDIVRAFKSTSASCFFINH